ncbi:MAG: TIGR00269 family protein, partial [Candidatus Bilamarchaeaceae archaeon]
GRGERVGVAVSGGKDSFALLHALARIRKSLPFELVAITIDEGIPGYRDEALKRAEKACRELGVPQKEYSFEKEYGITISQIAKKGKENLCSYCGVLRRKLLNKKARELKMGRVAVGHNLDDVAQTAMLNLIRNEPMRFARFDEPLVDSGALVKRIRPLVALREKEVAAYAYLHGYRFNSGCCCPHSSNAMRWAVRHQVNFLEDRYPGTKQKISSSFSTLQRIVREKVAEGNLQIGKCKECGEPSSADLCMACKMLNAL